MLILALIVESRFRRQGSTVLFTPGDEIWRRIAMELEDATKSIDIAVYDFDNEKFASELIKAKGRGVEVHLIIDHAIAQKHFSDRRSPLSMLRDSGIDIKTKAEGRGVMHHKFAIFDGKLVLTGSRNWTFADEKNSYENVLITSDSDTVKRYKDEFERIWRE